jgi:transposase
MITVEKREQIRRAYFIEQKSMRAISRELHCSRETIKKAIASAEPEEYALRIPRPAPVLGSYKARIDELLVENETLPRKQRYTGRKIYELVYKDGYRGSESGVYVYIWKQRREKKRPQVYLPLEFDPGTDAQVDWGEAIAIMSGQQVTVQMFVMRLCYSRRRLVTAYPTQRQECFLDGHKQAFHFFEGVPQRVSYDNLKTAVKRVLEGRKREEQRQFIVFRSHYLFESRFCTPAQGHEKGGVESDVGFSRRNFMVPIPRVSSFTELNALLLERCRADDGRTVDRQPKSIGQMWAEERPRLRALPEHDFDCCATRAVTLNGYGQVQFETNRYSVPADKAQRNLVLKAYPFHIEVLNQSEVIARHPRCYERKQDILDPLHYLSLLEQRPGAFEHAKPIRRWRARWPAVYETLLTHLRQQWPEGRGVREFVRILGLHRHHPADVVAQAIEQALNYNCAHSDGVTLCLRQLTQPDTRPEAIDLTDHPQLLTMGVEAPDLACYDQLLVGRA